MTNYFMASISYERNIMHKIDLFEVKNTDFWDACASSIATPSSLVTPNESGSSRPKGGRGDY